MKVSKFAAIGLFIFVLLLTSACINNIAGEWEGEELARVKSPDGIVDALLVRWNGGATTSYSYSVYLVPSGAKFDKDSALFAYDRALFDTSNQKDLQLVWVEPKSLEIRHRKDVTSNSRFSWHSPEVQNDAYVVEVKLTPIGEALLKNGR